VTIPAARRTRPLAIRWPLVLLTASLGLVLITTFIALAAARNHRASTAQLLHDYAAFAAWSYAEHLAGEFEETVWFTVNPIEHRQPHRHRDMPVAGDLATYRSRSLQNCHCDPPARPATYFRFRLGSDSLQTAGEPLPAGLGASLADRVTRGIHARGVAGRDGVLHVASGGRLAAYGLMPTTWGDTMVYGFTFDSAGVVAAFDSVLANAPLLPSAVTRGQRNIELLTLEIRDTSGQVLFQSEGWPDPREWPYIAEESLPPLRGGLLARVSVRPSAAQQLLAGGFPRTPIPLLLLVGVLGVASSLMAFVQMRREGELARLRSDFVAAVSHELRTPLAQIRLFLDTLRLRRYDTEAEQEWLVGHLTRETTRLEHLVENVLAASRLDRGAISDLPLERLDLGREVRDAVTAFAPLAASRQVELETDLSENVIVLADTDALRQLLLNLLDNAVKFGPRGQTVRIALVGKDGRAVLTIADQGPGVPAGERERIWEPYYRGSTEATRAVGGSGIGLAIVRETVARLQGTASVTQVPSGGAEFRVELPLAGPP
jgi:signal transduction histidine kinase